MNIGSLNKRVEIQAITKVPDGLGGFVNSYVTLYTADAAIWDATGNERNQASATTLVISHRIRIRYKAGFKAAYRVKFGLRYFSIVSVVNPSEKNRYLDLLCKEAA